MIPDKASSSMPFLVLFRMPLFFFVSGFLAYKANLVWDLPTLSRLTAKKMRVQLIPTVVFFLFAACVIRTEPDFLTAVDTMLHSTTKGGYWFTLALCIHRKQAPLEVVHPHPPVVHRFSGGL